MPGDTCWWCGKPAVALCDYVLGFRGQLDETWHQPRIVAALEAYTCDAPMCADHMAVAGHVCGPDGCDSIDYCPAHPALDRPPRVRVLTPTWAKAERHSIRVQAARQSWVVLEGGDAG